jgi:hypothetical protein
MGIRRWFQKKLNFSEAAEKVGIEAVIRGGVIGERLDIMEGLDQAKIATWSGKYSKAVLPWLNIGKDRTNFGRVDGFLDFYNYYAELVKFNKKLKNPNLNELEEKLFRKLQMFAKEIMGISFTNPDDMKNIIVSKPIMMLQGRGQPTVTGGGSNPEKDEKDG